jgi:HAD superfamily hydrolase (TIGR01509 family)
MMAQDRCSMIKALIFDVDGTLAETEEGHRKAFNAAFVEAGLDWIWDVDLYRDLHRVTGGKERMRHYAERLDHYPKDISDADIARIHGRKNAHYAELVREGQCSLRPGVERIIRTSHAFGLRLAICTTSSRVNVIELLQATLGADGPALFEVVVTGEDAAAKKPAPDAYFRTLEALALPAEQCLAFEDSRNGLMAARAAGLATIVTPSLYTHEESFDGAALVTPDLVDFDLIRAGFVYGAAAPH